MKLSLFADADKADRCNDRRSVSGVAVMLGNTDVSASSTTQHCVTLSTIEAEYVAMAHGAKTALAIEVVLDFVQPHLSGEAIDMYEDNEGANALAECPGFSLQQAHGCALSFSAKACEVGAGKIHSVASVEQHADIFTEPLGQKRHSGGTVVFS